MSKPAAASPSKLPAVGAPTIEKLPGGEVKFSIRLEGPREQVYLFAKKNDAVNVAKDGASGLHGTSEDHGDGTLVPLLFITLSQPRRTRMETKLQPVSTHTPLLSDRRCFLDHQTRTSQLLH